MIQLVYVSSAREKFDKASLVRLLAHSRDNNQAQGITGMLLYKDGNFLQVLEGEAQTVRDLYERIQRDPRHQNTIVMLDESISQRTFPDWSMGFRDLDDPQLKEMSGFSELMNSPRMKHGLGSDLTGYLYLIDFFRAGR